VFYGFYAPFEEALKLRLENLRFSDELSTRLDKTALLRNDLNYLGVSPENIATCQMLPRLEFATEILGSIYVVEGATLGGRIITKHVKDTLNILPTSGGSFFQGYGDATAMMWQGMRQLLVNGANNPSAENAIVASAIETFTALRNWSETSLNQQVPHYKVGQ
jgi:heme oxygenase (biliverdin-IX-beta and delta-forming)